MSKTTIRRATVADLDKLHICTIHLQKAGEHFQIGFGASENADKGKIETFAGLVKEELEKLKADGESEKLIELAKDPSNAKEGEFWKLLLSRLNLSNYLVEEIPIQDMGIEVIFDENASDITASVKALHKNVDLDKHRDTATDVLEKITNKIRGQARLVLDGLQALQDEGRHSDIEAKLISASSDPLITFSGREDLADLMLFIKGLDMSKFSFDGQDKLTLFMISLAGLSAKQSLVYEELCQYDEAHPHIERNLHYRLQLLKAQGALQKGMPELAYAIYKNLTIQKKDMDINNLALVYDGLAGLQGISERDIIMYTEYAADAFLEAGNQAQASACYCRLADRIGLSELKSAIKYFEEAEKLIEIIQGSQKESYLSQIAYRKACLYYRANLLTQARVEIKKSCQYQSRLLSTESFKISILRLAHILAVETGDSEDAKHIQGELTNLKKTYPDREQWLRDQVINYTRDPIPEMASAIDKEIMQDGSIDLKAEWLILKAITGSKLPVEDRIALLEQSNSLIKTGSKALNKEEHFASLYSAYGFIYIHMSDDSKALSYYRQSLKHDPYQRSARQNYAALLFRTKNWSEAEKFFEKEIERFGDLPGILFGYGRALLEQGNKAKAAGIFNRANRVIQSSSPKGLEALVQEYLQKSLDGIEQVSQVSTGAEASRSASSDKSLQPTESIRITIADFRKCIEHFCEHVKSQERMSFWSKDKSNNEYEWVSSPEAHAKTLFRTAINMYYKDALETVDEVSTGAGRIDLYLIFRNGVRAVLELKMCGDGYSRNYALEGHEQIVHYMENRKTHIGFLIVFDGRLRDYGKGIPEIVASGNQTIYSYCVDVRHTFKSAKI